MASTEQLIEDLSKNLQPVKPAGSPYILFIKWLCFTIIYIIAALAFLKLRGDIAGKLLSPLYMLELVMLTMVIMTTSLAAVLLSFPDMFQKNGLVFLPIVAFKLLVITIAIEYIASPPDMPLPVHGIECLLCITTLSLLPTLVMFRFLRRSATTHYYMAGAVSLLGAFTIGALILRLSENTDSINHLIKWHYAPMLGFGIVGLILGRKFLKW